VSESLLLWQRSAKRILDIVGAVIGLILSAPIIAVSALAIKLDSPGPIFFTQERAGENGKPFRFIKLRTMVSGAEKKVHEVLGDNPLSGPVFKIPNDPRVTRVGRLLRRWSLDELPQFWNVLRGEMSLVGPRPEECWVVDQYDDRQRIRLTVKPGLTGPMQVSGRGELDMEARLELELDYIEHYKFWRDISILFRSIPAILSGQGAL
jgi:lipopolysaccharide/colanic/teichoic acid biosynthesis glycosyltransferase